MIGSSHFKGDFAELHIAGKLAELGFKIAIPFGQNWRYDLIAVSPLNSFIRIQCKYTNSEKTQGKVIAIRCKSRNGKNDYRYTKDDFDWIVVYDHFTTKIYALPSSVLDTGMHQITLRSTPPRNNQTKRIRYAADYELARMTGADPATSDVTSRCSTVELHSQNLNSRLFSPTLNSTFSS